MAQANDTAGSSSSTLPLPPSGATKARWRAWLNGKKQVYQIDVHSPKDLKDLKFFTKMMGKIESGEHHDAEFWKTGFCRPIPGRNKLPYFFKKKRDGEAVCVSLMKG